MQRPCLTRCHWQRRKHLWNHRRRQTSSASSTADQHPDASGPGRRTRVRHQCRPAKLQQHLRPDRQCVRWVLWKAVLDKKVCLLCLLQRKILRNFHFWIALRWKSIGSLPKAWLSTSVWFTIAKKIIECWPGGCKVDVLKNYGLDFENPSARLFCKEFVIFQQVG